MNSFLTPQFMALYRTLPERVRQQARQAYTLFSKTRITRAYVSAASIPLGRFSPRVGIDYRVVGIRDDNDVYWFWIGAHADYDQLLKKL